MVNLRSPRELNQMRKAGIVVWEAHQLAARLVKPGVTTADLNAAIEEHFRLKNAKPLFKGVPGKVPFPASACISVNDEVVHGIPGGRKLKEGDVVSVDTGARLDGWCADSAYTHPVGKVAPEVQRLLDVTKQTLHLAIDRMSKYKRWSEVATDMGNYVRKAGFYVVENFVGHGIGRDMHEDPQVPNFATPQLKRSGDFWLEPGLVIAIEPMVNMGTKKVKGLSDHWTQVTQDGSPSAHFEHTVAVTETGTWILTTGPEGEL